MVIREAMNDQQQAHHEFVRGLVTSARDHEHELELQDQAAKLAPKPSKS
jgi:hypothetical protein